MKHSQFGLLPLSSQISIHFSFNKNRFYLFIFRERGKEGKREGEKHQCVVVSRAPPTGDLAHNPGMCPDWESNWQPFASQSSTQSTEPHQPGQVSIHSLKWNLAHPFWILHYIERYIYVSLFSYIFKTTKSWYTSK